MPGSLSPVIVAAHAEGGIVGTCSVCAGGVSRDGRGGFVCPCGATRISRAFLAWGVASAKPGPR